MLQGGDMHMNFCPVPGTGASYRAADQAASPVVGAHAIPLVHGDDERAARVERVFGDVGIVLSDTAPGVNHEHHNVRIGDRLEGLHDRKLLDRLENTALLAETGRIHERERMTVVLEVDIDRVAGRARAYRTR